MGPALVLPVDSAPAVKRISRLSPPALRSRRSLSGIICRDVTCVEGNFVAEIAERAVDLALLM